MRKEFAHPTEPLTIAFGVDSFLKPGDPSPQTFVQIWDTSQYDMPCNEGEGGFNNITANEVGLDFEAAHRLATQHGFNVAETAIFEIFD